MFDVMDINCQPAATLLTVDINCQPDATRLMIDIKHQLDTVMRRLPKNVLYSSKNDKVQSKSAKIVYFFESRYPEMERKHICLHRVQ